MTVNRTTLLDLPLPVTGTESGTWGDTTNNGLTQYMDIAIAGMSNLTSANFTTGALTIETTEGNSSATNISATSAQYAGFRVTSLAQNSTITVGNTGTSPARSYRLINADATYTLTFKATGQTGITLQPGQTAVVAFNGTDYVIVGMAGAGTVTDNAVVRFDGTTGKLVQNSVVTIADSTGDVAGVGALTMGGNLTLNGGTANGVLYLNGSKVATSGSALTFDGTNFSTTGTATATKLVPTGNVTAGNGMYLPATNTLAWSNNGAETMRLDSSGNLGLGVTPSAWSSHKIIQVGDWASFGSFNGNNNSIVMNNTYWNGSNYIYIGSNAASYYAQIGGIHAWYTAPSGTAGNTLTFTQAMTLDASGNLNLGMTGGGGRLNIGNSAGTNGQVDLYVRNLTSGTAMGLIKTGSSYSYAGVGANTSWLYSQGTDTLTLGADGAAPITFVSNGAERARITSGGDLLVGTTTSSGKVTIEQSAFATGLYVNSASGAGGANIHHRVASTSSQFALFTYVSSDVGSITTNGTVTLYNTTSDERLKENIANADSSSAIIDSLQVRKFDWKSDGSHQRYGFVAQELVTVAPEAVYQPEDSEAMMAVDYSKLVPMLVKEIQSLRQRVALLEGN